MAFTRGYGVALFAVGTALGAGAAQAADLTPFSFGTNWVAQAEHGGYYQAVADGTYEACGLDVTIQAGGPQVNGRALMIAGRLDAYMGGNMIQPWNAISEGIPIIVVGANFQKEPQVVMTHPGRVSSMEEMAAEGLEVLTDDGANLSWYKILINQYGFKEENRGVYTYNSAPFIADENKAQQGYVTSEPYAIEQATGWAPDVWLLADYGYIGYSTTIEMMKPFVEENPELVKCFVDGTAKGWYNYLYGDNSAANALIQNDNPDMTDGQIAYSIEAMKRYGIADSGDALELGINAMTDETMKEIFETFVELGLVAGDLDFTAAYTTEFVNKGVGLDIKKSLVGE
ncbi:MAG: ABC transporter substrate-binding protein [Pseudomonadota bacterium]